MGQLPVDRDEDSIFPTSRIVISNDSKDQKHKVNFIDNIILEAGELWRNGYGWKWLRIISYEALYVDKVIQSKVLFNSQLFHCSTRLINKVSVRY